MAQQAAHSGHHPHHHSRPRLAEPTSTPPGEDWLEVFYDLIFGVAIIELSQFLDARPDPGRLLLFLGLLIPTWWVWMGWTVYVSRFEADDAPHRLLTFVQMLAIAAMAVQIHDGHAGSAVFAAAFVVARLSLLALYLRARLRVPAAAPITDVYFRGFGAGVFLWAVSILVPPPGRYWLWGAGLTIDLLTPWVARPILQRLPLDGSHLSDRLGAFTSIILGVAVAGVVTGVADMHWNPRAVIAALLGFTIAVCIWWLRAEFIGRTNLRPATGSGQPFVYVHLPIVVGLAVMSVGVQRVIIRAATGEFDPATFWLLGGGAATWLAANIVVNFVIARRRNSRLIVAYIVALLIALSLPLIAPVLPAPAALALLTAAFIALVLTECRPASQPQEAA